ncbi:MAG: hypothetical protein KAT46_06130 [Deltaproteobacteria bacterium]|nr:hypothetical protein [Deltaproteobacteria bacterium]
MNKNQRLFRKKIKVIILALLFLSLTTETFATGGENKDEPVLAFVGKSAISYTSVQNKIKVEQAYGNKTITEASALVSLINEATQREVARLHWVVASNEELDQVAAHAELTSKARDILKAVQRIYGENINGYREDFLRPKVINKKLHYLYSRDARLHAKEIRAIEEAKKLALTGDRTFKSVAEKTGLNFIEKTFEKKNIAEENSRVNLPSKLEKYFPKVMENTVKPKNDLERLVGKLKSKEIFKNIIENDSSYFLIKLIDKTNKGFETEMIVAKKIPFDIWFRDVASGLEVGIANRKIEEEIRSKYPNLWWVR